MKLQWSQSKKVCLAAGWCLPDTTTGWMTTWLWGGAEERFMGACGTFSARVLVSTRSASQEAHLALATPWHVQNSVFAREEEVGIQNSETICS